MMHEFDDDSALTLMGQGIPVLICGGGPVGLALAGDLGWRGIRCALIEQGDGAITTPKMNEVNTRTMEFCRRWKISDAVLNCPFPVDYPQDVVFVTTMSGYELGRIARLPRCEQTPELYSPMQLQVCSQLWFDPILQKLARSFPHVGLHYRHRLDDFETTSDGVIAKATNLSTGKTYRIEAGYLIGCDGVKSLVRHSLNIALVGEEIGSALNLFFRAPKLLERCGQKPGNFFFLFEKGEIWASLRIIDPVSGLWRLMIDNVDSELKLEAVDRVGYLQRALGQPFDVEWVGASVWRRRSAVAAKYGHGRVFLVGDAAHQHSPQGALGMNTGIGDAVDLCWKLAARLDGWGGDGLLDSYESERRPIGLRNARMATQFYRSFSKLDGIAANDLMDHASRGQLGETLVREIGREFRTIGLQIGYCYDQSPICMTDNTPSLKDDPEFYVPSTRSGARAPHVWLNDGRSLLDIFGRGFVLLCFSGAPKIDDLMSAASSSGVPMTAVSINERKAAALYERKLVLVRPDGHVAWLGDVIPPHPEKLIDIVRGAV